MARRKVDIAVLSDLHLGTYGCHSKEILNYLKSINPKTLILNGDIVDIWNFRKRYFPKEHLRIIYEIIKLSQKNTKVWYITGNHDDLLRQFSDTDFGNIHLVDKLSMNIDNKKYWFFHGDIFDASIQHAKWLAKLGGKGYDLLIWINRIINRFALSLGQKPMSFSRKIKENVKKAVKYIDDFEQTAVDIAIENEYDYVVCGHIHQPCIKTKNHKNKDGEVIYMNSGDWIENLTSLEYVNGQWNLYQYDYETEDDIEELESILNVPQNVEASLLFNTVFHYNFQQN